MALSSRYILSYAYPSRTNVQVYQSKYGWRTKPKASTPTPYTSEIGVLLSRVSNQSPPVFDLRSAPALSTMQQAINSGSGPAGTALSSAYNRAYSKLMACRSGQAENLTSIVELNSSLTMITQRARSLGNAYLALRKGNFRKFVRELSLTPDQIKPRHRTTRWTKPKYAANLWLEYWFGWAPAIGDIFTSLEVMQNFQPYKQKAVGRGAAVYSYRDVSTAWGRRVVTDHKIKLHVRMEFMWRVDNPNTWLLARLGLLNPALTAFQVIPFSWLLNWVLNVEQYLSSWSDNFGATWDPGFTTYYASCVNGSYSYNDPPNSFFETMAYSLWKMNRFQGSVPKAPTLQWQMPQRLSITRAITSISVLTQLFDDRTLLPRKK